jgi:putative ABC transport system permease protein
MKFGDRLRSRFWRLRVDDEVDAEFEFHVEMRVRELVAGGMDREEARRTAIARFGNIGRVNATCRAIGRQRESDMRRTEYFSEMKQDVAFACRQILRSPGFSAIAILTLALGIGGTTAIFSAVRSVVLRPLPFSNPERIVVVNEELRGNRSSASAGNFVDGIEPVDAFSAVTAVQYSNISLSGDGDAERVVGARATAGFFGVFDIPAELGRVFTKEEDQPGREQVVVLSHRLWARRFGSDPSIVGRQITLNGRPHDVIGVMPARFDFTADGEELWLPIAFTPERRAMHDEHYLTVYGRLRAGVTAAMAIEQMQARALPLRQAYPRQNVDLSFTAVGALENLIGNSGRRLLTLLGAVGFVLLIACGNVANLLLARGAARGPELAIRAALGAGRGRIARQMLTESLVLAGAAAVVGVALAAWGVRALIAAAPPGVPRLEQTRLDMLVLAFTLGIAMLSAILFGIAPARRAAKADLIAVVKDGGRGAVGGVRDRLRTALIVAELAVALVLLAGAGLLIRSSLAMQRVDPGFESSGVFSARLTLPTAAYGNRDAVVQALDRLAQAASAIPGATSAGVTTQVPMAAGGNGNGLLPEGKEFDRRNLVQSRLRMVTPGYFATMGIPILRGRALNETDRRGGLKVMVISEALARAAYPDQDPVGKRIACCETSPDGKTPDYKVVVGVAGDVRSRGLSETPSPEFYLPIDQVPPEAWDWVQRTAYVVVRTPQDPMAMANPLRAAVREVTPGVPLFQLRTMDERLRDSTATARFNTMLLSILGSVGLILSCIGIYGVIAYFVSRRTQEIGVRMALGATKRDVVALVFRQAAWPVGIGIVLGVILSGFTLRVLSTQLFEVSAYDPMTFAAVIVTLGLASAVASLIPAGRAASVDPTQALRDS